MARDLRIASACVDRPDERWIPADQRVGSSVAVNVVSMDLKGQPVHTVRLTEGQAVGLLADLAKALDIIYTERRRP